MTYSPLPSLQSLHYRATRLSRRIGVTRRTAREIVAQKAGFADYAAAAKALPRIANPTPFQLKPKATSLVSIIWWAGRLAKREGIGKIEALERASRKAGFASYAEASQTLLDPAR